MIDIESTANAEPVLLSIKKRFEDLSGLSGLKHEIASRPGGPILVIHLVHPTERMFGLLTQAIEERGGALESTATSPLATLKRASATDLLRSPEARLLQKALAESLTVNRFSFASDFFARYVRSVSGAEEQIVSSGNHVVLGRRGSGKSSLLLYALHSRRAAGKQSAWVDMQTYLQRSDNGVVIEILRDVLSQAKDYLHQADSHLIEDLQGRFLKLSSQEDVPDSSIKRLLPEMRRLFSRVAAGGADFTIFLDDCHVIDDAFQPKLLSFLYSFSRGNQISIKVSAIEMFTRLWDPSERLGLEVPHDAQLIKLDYNLAMPEKAKEHISSILDGHAQYCGLPSVRVLCTEAAVLSRLVWVAAGVPRDALNLFSLAMSKAAFRTQKRVTATNVNQAASEQLQVKLQDVERDISGRFAQANQLLGKIREFCLKDKKRNAFLVQIRHDSDLLRATKQLVDLRLLHVINEGIVKNEAGEKFMALILDYGFYTGMRKAKNLQLVTAESGPLGYKEVRQLPVYGSEGT